MGRAEQGAGGLLRDHDRLAGALEGEQPVHATSSTTGAGSTTCPRCRARRRGRSTPPISRSRARRRRWTSARRCGSTATRSSTSGASSRARRRLLALQATRMLWSPVPRESDASGSGTARHARRTIEPAFVIGLYALALRRLLRRAAALRRARRDHALATTRSPRWCSRAPPRYRTPWDFLLAILAAFALAAAWERSAAGGDPTQARARARRAPRPAPHSARA